MIVTGSEHLIVPKRLLLVAILAMSSVFGGVLVSNHLYARKVEAFLAAKTRSVKNQNKQLGKEQEDYQEAFRRLTRHLDQDGSLDSTASFHQLATRLLEGLQTMQDLLEEKEFQLWEKEGLLDYQEERLTNTEVLEQEMAGYINIMAKALLQRNQTLPDELVDQSYFGNDNNKPSDEQRHRTTTRSMLFLDTHAQEREEDTSAANPPGRKIHLL